jgi:hypothetical protein
LTVRRCGSGGGVAFDRQRMIALLMLFKSPVQLIIRLNRARRDLPRFEIEFWARATIQYDNIAYSFILDRIKVHAGRCNSGSLPHCPSPRDLLHAGSRIGPNHSSTIYASTIRCRCRENYAPAEGVGRAREFRGYLDAVADTECPFKFEGAAGIFKNMQKVWRPVQRLYWDRIATQWQRANHELRSTDRNYASYIAEAEKKHDQKEADRSREEWAELRRIDEEKVNALSSAHYEKWAARCHVPVPPYGSSPYWQKNWLTGGYNLTVEGIDFIESRIYEKRKRRWEFWLLAIPIVIGVIGAVTGLLAVWRH